MAEITRPPRQERLLIKVIMPKQCTERKVPGGGTPPKPFRPVDAEIPRIVVEPGLGNPHGDRSADPDGWCRACEGEVGLEGGSQESSAGASVLGAILPDRGRRQPR